MPVKKRPDMSPVGDRGLRASKTLMGNLDTAARGDGAKVPKIPTTILLPADLKDEAQRFARENDSSLTSIIIQGLKMRMGKEF